MGSFDACLPNGNKLVGWGQIAVYDEYGPEGDLRWQAEFGKRGSVFSYRAYRAEWTATPAEWDPVLVVSREAFLGWKWYANLPRVGRERNSICKLERRN